jgi:hypothetical protein
MSLGWSIARIGFCLSVVGGFAQAGVVFTFDTDTLGSTTTFTDTVGGLSATFSSPSDPGGFTIYPNVSVSPTFTGNNLLDLGPPGNLPLTIAFNGPIFNISLLFATIEAAPLELDAFDGATQVGTISATGTVPDGFDFPTGTITFGGVAFDRVVLSSTASNFAIDDVDATQTPEASSLLSVGLGLGLLGWLYRRSHRSEIRGRA